MKTILILVIGLVVLLVVAAYIFAGSFYRAAMSIERKMAGLSSRTIDIDEIHYSYTDSEHGVPLLLIHGFSADKDNWTRVAKHLTGQYRVIAPDLPGFGDSSRDPTLDYSINAQVERIISFADALGLKQFHLGGSSMGGAIAGSLAARHSERVLSLWLLAPAGVETGQQSEMETILASDAIHPLIPGDRHQFENTLDFVFSRRPFLPAPLRRYLAQVAVERQVLLTQIYAGLIGDTGGSIRASLNTLLAGLPVPTLITWGTEDRVLHPAGAKTLGALIPNATVAMMPGVGHLPMLETPRKTAKKYLLFQSGHSQ